eukprot:NODE_80_length_22829_cov_0.188121.p6 type:complete len:287 gc:universal NODE_80_length_22829_cov_0.188121:3881-3021(-)
MTAVCVKCKSPSDDKCIFHPGKPVFHDGLKGYTCCEKRVIDFDDFLKIEGCQSGQHQEREVESESKVLPSRVSAADKPKVESIKTPANSLIPTTVANKSSLEIKEDPADFIPKIGMRCQRLGCSYEYDGDPKDCQFHKGIAIFHEGSKGYNCCKRKVLEFDEFVKIKGCTTGNHMYTPSVKPARHDWYQSMRQMHVSVFAKNVDSDSCKVLFNPFSITLNAPGVYFHVELHDEIVPSDSKMKILKTKIELTLEKKVGGSWPSLDATSTEKVFTTFGTSGSGTTDVK